MRWIESNPLFAVIYRYGRPYWKYFVVGLLSDVLRRIPEFLPAFVLAVAYNAVFWETHPYTLPLVPEAVIPGSRMGQFWFTVGILLVSYPLTAILTWISNRLYGYFIVRLQHDLRTDTYDELQRKEMSYFEGKQTGEIMSILNNDVNQLSGFLNGGLRNSTSLLAQAIVIFMYMALLNWQLAVLVVICFLAYPLVNVRFARIIEPLHLAKRQRVGSLNSRLETNVSGNATIKAYATEDEEREEIEESSRSYFDASWDVIVERIKMEPQTTVIGTVTMGIVFMLGGIWILDGPPLVFTGAMSAGVLAAFVSYLYKFQGPFRNITGVVDSYESGLASANRIQGLLDESTAIRESPDAYPLEDVEGAVSFNDVSFSYEDEGEPTLSSVSLDVEPGSTVGIVGPTGAGKSTLIKLLLRLYDPDSGSITIDGTDIRSVTLSSLRRSIGYVSQDSFLFYGSARENIAYGVPDADIEAVRMAAKLAGAHEFITELPEGYDTMVGERGVKLSGGQRQRIAIARTLLKDPAIVVLDEATSHVDNETEVLIQQGIDELSEERTTFAVAHRLSTVKDADTIVVIDDGTIVESGDHETLIEQGGMYATLWGIQVGDESLLSDTFLERINRREQEVIQ